MATKFAKDQQVKVNAINPQGPVQKLRMDEDGVIWYQISWVDVHGQEQSRWFREDDLIEA